MQELSLVQNSIQIHISKLILKTLFIKSIVYSFWVVCTRCFSHNMKNLKVCLSFQLKPWYQELFVIFQAGLSDSQSEINAFLCIR